MNQFITEQMLLELKEAVNKGDQSAIKVWDNMMIPQDKKDKIEQLIKNKNPDNINVISSTPKLRNIYIWTAPFMSDMLYIKMREKINTFELNNLDQKSLKIEEESNENKKGSILFSHQRDQGLIYWCPNNILNKSDMSWGKAWPKNAKLIDTFDF